MRQFVTVFDFMQLLVRCWDQPSDDRGSFYQNSKTDIQKHHTPNSRHNSFKTPD